MKKTNFNWHSLLKNINSLDVSKLKHAKIPAFYLLALAIGASSILPGKKAEARTNNVMLNNAQFEVNLDNYLKNIEEKDLDSLLSFTKGNNDSLSLSLMNNIGPGYVEETEAESIPEETTLETEVETEAETIPETEPTIETEVVEETVEETTEAVELTAEEKIDICCEKFQLTYDEFLAVLCTVFAESKDSSYEDAYHVISCIYNRTIDRPFVDEINRANGRGNSLYGQVSAVVGGYKQFSGYQNKTYYRYLAREDKLSLPVAQAVIDFMMCEVPSNNYLAFKSSGSNPNGKVQYVKGGNRFHMAMKENDIIPVEERITYRATQETLEETLEDNLVLERTK